MLIIDACNAKLQPAMIREAVKSLPPFCIARTGIEQVHAWESLGISITSDEMGPMAHATTMAGFPLVADLDMLPDRIRFELDGKVVAKIVNLRVTEL